MPKIVTKGILQNPQGGEILGRVEMAHFTPRRREKTMEDDGFIFLRTGGR